MLDPLFLARVNKQGLNENILNRYSSEDMLVSHVAQYDVNILHVNASVNANNISIAQSLMHWCCC